MTVPSLEGLTLEEKRLLADQLAYDLRSTKEVFDAEETDFWDALMVALEHRGQDRRPMAPFVKSCGRAVFREAAARVRRYVAQSCGEGLRRPVRNAVQVEVLRCLVSHLDARNFPATPQIMINSLGQLGFAVEQRFPGYAAVRMLHRVVVLAAA